MLEKTLIQETHNKGLQKKKKAMRQLQKKKKKLT